VRAPEHVGTEQLPNPINGESLLKTISFIGFRRPFVLLLFPFELLYVGCSVSATADPVLKSIETFAVFPKKNSGTDAMRALFDLGRIVALVNSNKF